MRKFTESAEGVVFLLSRYPLGPRPTDAMDASCSFWWMYIFPTLRGLLSYAAVPRCIDWSGIPSRGPIPGKPIWGVKPTFDHNPSPDPTINAKPPLGNPKLPFSPIDFDTVEMTQYARQFPSSDPTKPVSNNYQLDMTILDPAGQIRGQEVHRADASPGQTVDVYRSDQSIFLYVTIGADDTHPYPFGAATVTVTVTRSGIALIQPISINAARVHGQVESVGLSVPFQIQAGRFSISKRSNSRSRKIQINSP